MNLKMNFDNRSPSDFTILCLVVNSAKIRITNNVSCYTINLFFTIFFISIILKNLLHAKNVLNQISGADTENNSTSAKKIRVIPISRFPDFCPEFPDFCET